jgi:outer membrane protein TolC
MTNKKTIITAFALLFFYSIKAQQVFTNLDSLLQYATKKSIVIHTNSIRISQAQKAKLAAILSIPDLTSSINLNYTDNTSLPVSLFPDATNPGKFNEIQMGQKYSTQLSQNLDVKLINLAGWENLKLSKINIDLSNSNQQLTIKSLQENIATNYYNILNLQHQIINSKQNLLIADTLFKIAEAKYNKGLVKQQDVNDSKVNMLNSKENIEQLAYLQKQYYLSLKVLCDIPENENIVIQQPSQQNNSQVAVPILNSLSINNSLLKEKYALSNYKQVSKSMLPTFSFTQNQSYTLYNQDFKLFDGKWFKGAAIGFKLAIPIPNASSIGNNSKAKFDYEIAKKTTEQETIKANLTKEQLNVDYYKALSQEKNNKQVLDLRKDSYNKNRILYEQGLLSLDQTLNSYTAMVNAEYSLTTSTINIQLVQAKININNSIK